MSKVLRPMPLTLKQANALVLAQHRHHGTVIACRWAVGCGRKKVLAGAATVGRPVARLTDQYAIAEVTRLVADGSPHVCSFLYSRSARIAREMGFDEIQTFILESEPGTSLLAAGWERDEKPTRGGEWSRPSRGRRKAEQDCPKRRWFKKVRQIKDEAAED